MIESSPAETRARELVENGRAARARGDYEAALAFLTDAAEISPRTPQVLLPLAGALFDSKSYEGAKAVYASILEHDSDNTHAHYGLGRIARQMGEAETALKHFRAAADADAVDPVRRMTYALQLLNLKDLDEAEEQFQKILAKNPRQPRALLSLGRIARMRDDPEAALDLFRAAADIDPDNSEIQKEIAQTFVLLNRADEAEVFYRKVLSLDPTQQGANLSLLKIARQRGDWPVALQIAEAASDAEPSNLKLRAELGNALRDLMRYDEAEAVYNEVPAGASTDIDALCGLGDVARLRGDTSKALWYMEMATRASPGNARVHEATRDLSLERGSFDWKNEFETAVRIVRAGDAPVATLLTAARTLLDYGVTDILHPVLARLEKTSPHARKIAQGVRELERAGLAQSVGQGQPDLNEFQLEEVTGFVEKPVAGSDTLLIAFSGTNNRMAFTLSLMDRFLRKTGISVVYVRDITRNRYLGGIVGLGDDFAATARAFADMAARYGAKRILTLGNCTGCLGALRYGAALGAEAILGLSPALGSQRRDAMKPAQMERFTALRNSLPKDHKTLDVLFAEMKRKPSIAMIYGEQCLADAKDAQSIARFPDVTLVPIPDFAEHHGLRALLMRGLLAPLLSGFVSERRVASEIQAKIRASADS